MFGWGHPHAVLVVQALIDLAGCWLLWDCARTEVSRRAGWAVLLLAVFCPFTAAYAVTGLTESLSIFCVALAIWALARLVRAARAGKPEWGPLLALSAAMSYGMLLRPDGVLLTAAFCVGILLVYEWLSGNRARFASCGGGGCAGGAAAGSVDDSQ